MPSCKNIDSIVSTNKDMLSNNRNSRPWYYYYLIRFSENNVEYLLNQKNGDDWIVGWYKRDGFQVQFVDSRTFTIVLKLPKGKCIDLQRDISFSSVFNALGAVVNFSGMFLNEDSKLLVVDKKNNHIKGYFSSLYFSFSEKKKDFIWTNGEYVVLDIVKLNKPIKAFKGVNGYYNYNQIIGGIPKDDSKSFTRFRKSTNIDMEKEMFKVFPWMVDSIKYFQAHPDTTIYGKTPW
jgi:hypothetical protein